MSGRVRAFAPGDLGRTMDLWLAANLDAHAFVPAAYWREHLDEVAVALPKSEVWVYEEGGAIRGFLGLVGDFIAGLFVEAESRSCGVGGALLAHAKLRRPALALCVFEENARARAFYEREGFTLRERRMSDCPPHWELCMGWERRAAPKQPQRGCMDMESLADLVELLASKDHTRAYEALKELEKRSGETDEVYRSMDRLIELMADRNSYVRTRGLLLFALNAKWDVDGKVEGALEAYLSHLADPKPVTARQCIRMLPVLARGKPALREPIVAALRGADFSGYAASMRPLLEKDLQAALEELREP